MRSSSLLASLTTLATLALCGCSGYHIGPVKPAAMREVRNVAVSTFKNDTLEPRVEVLLANALISRMHQDGTYKITAEQDADVIVQGTLERIDRLAARSANRDFYQTSEYTLDLVANIKATDRRTGRILLEKKLTGHSSFYVTGRDTRTADISRDERQSLPSAADDLAGQISSYLSEGW